MRSLRHWSEFLAVGWAAGLMAVNCQPGVCTDDSAHKCPPCPCSAGGAKGTGGAKATGGTHATGGTRATGGTQATGGTTSTCTAVAFPDTPAPASATKQAKRPHLGRRHYRAPGRAMPTETSATVCSRFWNPLNWTPLNQGDTGSCTGNAGVGVISTTPYTSDAHDNETDARLAYQGGTCVDNGCSIPCTCSSCPAAFCPATNANDNGSNGSSVMTWMQNAGWVKGYTTADTTTQLIACLQTGPAVIGIDWYNSMFLTDKTGTLPVTVSSGLAGGHEIRVVGYDSVKAQVIIDNSWGLWGWCFAAQENSTTSTLGTGCGFARINVADLTKLNFDGDCPTR